MRLLALLLLLVGCGAPVDVEEADMAQPLAPWHMWGTSAVVTPVIQGPAGTSLVTTGQLARINYGRPDTWDFLFGVVVNNAVNTGGATVTLTVNFDLIIGLGRSNLQIPAPGSLLPNGFVTFQTSYVGAPANIIGRTLWTSTTRSSGLDTAVPPLQLDVDHFPAEDIQCNARVFAFTGGGGPAGQKLQVTVHSYFAPRSHIRPEWFTDLRGDGARFRGNEQGGS